MTDRPKDYIDCTREEVRGALEEIYTLQGNDLEFTAEACKGLFIPFHCFDAWAKDKDGYDAEKCKEAYSCMDEDESNSIEEIASLRKRLETADKLHKDSGASGLDALLENIERGEYQKTYPTGFHNLDLALDGGLCGKLYVIGDADG